VPPTIVPVVDGVVPPVVDEVVDGAVVPVVEPVVSGVVDPLVDVVDGTLPGTGGLVDETTCALLGIGCP
jgi:hypothetical protein